METRSDSDEPRVDDPQAVTSFHVRRAVGGDAESLGWIVERISPLLRAHAVYRLRTLPRFVEPEDLIQDAWMRVLPRLDDLRPRNGRITPVLLRFMTTIVNRRVRDLLQRLAGRPGASLVLDDVPDVASDHSSVVTRVLRSEARSSVQEALERLGAEDREVVVLRGIEQAPVEAVAAVLGTTPEAARKRYHRALLRLRDLVPASVFAELPDDP